MGDGLLGLYPISLVTGSLKPRPEASNPRIVSTGAGSDLIHPSAWKKNSRKFTCRPSYIYAPPRRENTISPGPIVKRIHNPRFWRVPGMGAPRRAGHDAPLRPRALREDLEFVSVSCERVNGYEN
jgi:hypothetical protein